MNFQDCGLTMNLIEKTGTREAHNDNIASWVKLGRVIQAAADQGMWWMWLLPAFLFKSNRLECDNVIPFVAPHSPITARLLQDEPDKAKEKILKSPNFSPIVKQKLRKLKRLTTQELMSLAMSALTITLIMFYLRSFGREEDVKVLWDEVDRQRSTEGAIISVLQQAGISPSNDNHLYHWIVQHFHAAYLG